MKLDVPLSTYRFENYPEPINLRVMDFQVLQ